MYGGLPQILQNLHTARTSPQHGDLRRFAFNGFTRIKPAPPALGQSLERDREELPGVWEERLGRKEGIHGYMANLIDIQPDTEPVNEAARPSVRNIGSRGEAQ